MIKNIQILFIFLFTLMCKFIYFLRKILTFFFFFFVWFCCRKLRDRGEIISKQKKKKNGYNTASKLVIFITILLLVFAGYIYYRAGSILKPDYAPGVIDKNAVPLPNDGEKNTAPEGGGSVSLSYSDKVAIDLSNKEIKLYFKNPTSSTHDMVLELVITQNDKVVVLGKSDLLPVGYAIYKLDLDNEKVLKHGGYDGKFRVYYYDDNTKEKAIVNTKIPVAIAVE